MHVGCDRPLCSALVMDRRPLSDVLLVAARAELSTSAVGKLDLLRCVRLYIALVFCARGLSGGVSEVIVVLKRSVLGVVTW